MARKYDSDSIVSLKNDIDRVRKRPTTYIPSTGKEGAIHIPFEIVDNSVDEVTVAGSVGDTVTMIFDNKSKEITVIDNGSGIPHGMMLDICTVINTSGKFENGEDTAYQFSGGTNGVGMKLAVFLSDWCDVTSMRDGKKLTYHFVDGKFKSEETSKTKDHGTIVKFKLSQRFVDIKSVGKTDMVNRYQEKSYLFPEVKLHLLVVEGDKEIASYMYSKKDIADRVTLMKPDTNIIRVSDTRKIKILKDIRDDEIKPKKVIVDVAFAFSEEALDVEDSTNNIISYGNTIKTYMGGAHVDGLKEGIMKYLKDKVTPKFSGKDSELQIMTTDVASGLIGFVVAKVYDPEFRGQFKDRLGNQEAKFAVRDAVYDALCDMKPSEVNPMIDFIKRVAKGRVASKKTRRKDVSSAFSKDRIDKFQDIIYNKNTFEPELILLEGDSAAGIAFSARDANNQAIYSVRKPKNMFDNSSDQVNSAQTAFNDIMDICGIEAGKKCDPSKSKMRRIWMLTDGDIDGDAIAFTTVCLLAKHCRPMIDAGMVGRILPPAYSFPAGKGKAGGRTYVRSQREFFQLITKHFIKSTNISHGKKEYSKSDLNEFLDKNFYYADRLDDFASWASCDAKFLEYISTKFHGDETMQKQSYWSQALKPYKDITARKEGNIIVIDGNINAYEYINLALDHQFTRRVNRFKDYQIVNDYITGYTMNDVKDLTIYDIMTRFRSYMPSDVKRFKGLGELSPKQLKELCMDRDKREGIIFKFGDIDTDMKKINVIMSTKREYAQERANILMNRTADAMDIDT